MPHRLIVDLEHVAERDFFFYRERDVVTFSDLSMEFSATTQFRDFTLDSALSSAAIRLILEASNALISSQWK